MKSKTIIPVIFLAAMLLLSACTQQKPENFVGQETPLQQQADVRKFTVKSDDYGFYPNKIEAKIGDKVIIHFKFIDDRIYYGGMDIKGPFPDVNYKLKGEQPISREFIMKEKTKITSWWPSSRVKKATLTVEVVK